MNKRIWFAAIPLLALTVCLLPLKGAFARPELKQDGIVTPAGIIDAVNTLRLTYGLAPLSVHPILTQVAQQQANALAASEGAVGHARPNGITLGQQLIMLGYPLSGDLTLDGYRSENWVAASTVDEAISFWLSDDLHTNTMLSQNRSDIGAGVAVGDQIYVVIDTALRTSSGLQQSEAYDILTQVASGAVAGASSGNSLISEYIIPVARSTARPDGDVFHKVRFGQTLWSIAVTYGVKIDQIRAWNNLGAETTIYEGQTLLVQRAATQPPPASATPRSSQTPFSTGTPTQIVVRPGFPTMTIQPAATPSAVTKTKPGSSTAGLWAGIVVMVAVVGGVVGAMFIRPSK